MRLFERIFGDQAASLERAMDRTTLRHQLLTRNLSNVNVPGYKRQDISFAEELDNARGRHLGQRAGHLGQDEVQTDTRNNRVDGSSVDLEKEIVALAETEIRYQALSDLTARHFSNLKNVIREGR